ncbi:MAG: tetratricopeptide repeat protein [Chitinophagaceae bacterium]
MILESAENYYIRGNNRRLSILGYYDNEKKEKLTYAINYYTKAIELHPNFIEALYWRGYSKRWFADITLDKLPHLEGHKSSIDLKIIIVHYADALKDYDAVINLNSNHEDALQDRSSLKNFIHDFSGALDDCNRLLLLKPNSGKAFALRGEIKFYASDYIGVIEDGERALLLDPDISPIDLFIDAAKSRLKKQQKTN